MVCCFFWHKEASSINGVQRHTSAIIDDFYDNAFVNVVYGPKTATY